MPHRHLQCGETSPRDTEHSYVSVRPWLMSQPRDYLLSIQLLLFGIFALRRGTLACAKTSNINAHAHVAAMRKIGVLRIISGRCSVVLPIRQIFQQDRELLSRL